LVDSLISINGTSLYDLTFQISNITDLQNQARALAFADSKSKAQLYAQLSGLTLGSPLRINETTPVSSPVVPYFLAGDTTIGQAT